MKLIDAATTAALNLQEQKKQFLTPMVNFNHRYILLHGIKK